LYIIITNNSENVVDPAGAHDGAQGTKFIPDVRHAVRRHGMRETQGTIAVAESSDSWRLLAKKSAS